MPYSDGQVAADDDRYFWRAPEPDFVSCGNCGADAKENCWWDEALGWCCQNCGSADMDERYA